MLLSMVRRPRARAPAARARGRPALARGRAPRRARPALRRRPGGRLDPASRRRRRWKARFNEMLDEVVAEERTLRRPPTGGWHGPAAHPGRGVPRRGGRRFHRPASAPGSARARLRLRRGGRRRPRRARARRGRAARPHRPDRRRARRHAGAPSRLQDVAVRSGVTGIANEGKLQLQLYMLVARERLGLDPIGGLYQPLGAAYGDRRPRGIVLKDECARRGSSRGSRSRQGGRAPARSSRARSKPRERARSRTAPGCAPATSGATRLGTCAPSTAPSSRSAGSSGRWAWTRRRRTATTRGTAQMT